MPHDEPSYLGGYPDPNTTPIPDKFFDRDLAQLSGAELKVLLYLFRRTYGFKKEADSVSLSQLCSGITKRNGDRLDSGTGLSRPSVIAALRTLEARGCIVSVHKSSPERGYEPTTYRIARYPSQEI